MLKKPRSRVGVGGGYTQEPLYACVKLSKEKENALLEKGFLLIWRRGCLNKKTPVDSYT